MTTFEESGRSLAGTRFTGVDLRGARFAECDVSGVVMRGVEASGLDVDAPWLEEGDGLVVNGVDVTAFVVAELERRFPGRALRRAETPAGLREAWAAVEGAWERAQERLAHRPVDARDASVDGEWSFAQTLRHLVHATDLWLRLAVLREPDPLHPIGLNGGGGTPGGPDLSALRDEVPTWEQVLAVRADRQAQVRAVLDAATPELLEEERRNPWSPERPETVRSCLHTILEEEWEHLRYALRDLTVLEDRAGRAGTPASRAPSPTSDAPAPTTNQAASDGMPR